MLSYVAMVVLALLGLYVGNNVIKWRRNIAAAKASGFPYIIVPFFYFQRIWLVFEGPAVDLMRRLPKAWTTPWLEVLRSLHGWEHRYSTFKAVGGDSYLTVAPGGIVMWTCSPDVIAQITQRRNDFPKPIALYSSIDVYGKNVVTTEGQYWRHQRKIVAPPFNERNNQLVWSESIQQAEAMMDSWTGKGKDESRSITSLATDTMRLSLHVISKAGFGKSLLWPGREDAGGKKGEEGKKGNGVNADTLTKGHRMTYTDALGVFLKNVIIVVALPHFLISTLSPFITTASHQLSLFLISAYVCVSLADV